MRDGGRRPFGQAPGEGEGRGQASGADHRQDERDGQALRGDVQALLLSQEGFRRRGGPLRGDPPVHGGLCRRRLPKSSVDLSASPHDVAENDPVAGRQGVAEAGVRFEDRGGRKGRSALKEKNAELRGEGADSRHTL
jgi:hypothetical protein